MKVAPKKAADSLFADSLYFSAAALAREAEKLAIECWKPAGLSPSLGHILYYLLYFDSISGPMIIAKNLFLSPSTVTRLLDKLEKKELVHRFIYDNVRMVEATEKAWLLEPVITECEFTFRKRCDAILGENADQTCRLLNVTTDILKAKGTVGTPTELSSEITDL